WKVDSKDHTVTASTSETITAATALHHYAGLNCVATAFIATMIWGYGTAGYGPYRTERVLREDPDALDHLLDVARICHDPSQGGLAAFRYITTKRGGQSRYLKYLGPAFGTKFLYFLTAASEAGEPTPVMDALVRRWFRDNTDSRLVTAWWDPDSYALYIDRLDEWGRELGGIRRDEVELLIFTDARGQLGTAWPGSVRPDPVPLPVERLLDLLAEETEALGDTKGNRGAELVEELGAWFSTNSKPGPAST
ncbi:hypothetical protein ACFQRD_09070, partial [Brachybacterium sp. GCM10030268]|uniref:8-oxoguanine DNA glycosylase OGG fold protein n=1 Tax=Brachybacterium sp. GCM10030268 TaxID=3273382 RepID=UPI003623150C